MQVRVQNKGKSVWKTRYVGGVSDGKTNTVADDDTGGSGSGIDEGEVTRMSGHMSGGTGVHNPIAATTGVGWRLLQRR